MKLLVRHICRQRFDVEENGTKNVPEKCRTFRTCCCQKKSHWHFPEITCAAKPSQTNKIYFRIIYVATVTDFSNLVTAMVSGNWKIE